MHFDWKIWICCSMAAKLKLSSQFTPFFYIYNVCVFFWTNRTKITVTTKNNRLKCDQIYLVQTSKRSESERVIVYMWTRKITTKSWLFLNFSFKYWSSKFIHTNTHIFGEIHEEQLHTMYVYRRWNPFHKMSNEQKSLKFWKYLAVGSSNTLLFASTCEYITIKSTFTTSCV